MEHIEKKTRRDHDVSYISHAGNLFWSALRNWNFIWDRRTAAEIWRKSPRACATILLPIGVIWLGFKIVFAVVPLLFKLVCAALICYLVYRILREMKLVA